MYKFLTGLLLLALMLLPAASASAQGLAGGLADGKVIFGDDFVLAEGQTLGGDLVVFGGNVTIEKDAVVEGSLAVIGGNASVAEGASINGDVAMIGGNLETGGTVNGDLAMVGGNATLDKTALVDGDISTVGGSIEQAEGAEVTGDIVDDVKTPTIILPTSPQELTSPEMPHPNMEINYNPFSGILGVFGQAFVLSIIAVLVSLFLQPQMERVSGAITSQPLVAGGFGLLTVALAPFALVILAVTIILSPVAFLGVILLALAWMFGMIALGQEVGERFTRSINQSWSAPLVAGAGTFVLVLVVGMVGLVPCFGWLAPFLVGLIGIGGVALVLLKSGKPQQAATISSEPLPPAS
jgi:cytoskeletal protein CcmA (bactofilin family)